MASPSTLSLLPTIFDRYNQQGGTLYPLPPVAPAAIAPLPRTLSSRRTGGLSMKIDLSPFTFQLPPTASKSAPSEIPNDWSQRQPFHPATYGNSAGSSRQTASSGQSETQAQDDFHLAPYPSPAIGPANRHGAPTFALPQTQYEFVPFPRSMSGGSVSLAPTPSDFVCESPAWQPRQDYWMDWS